MSGEKETAYVDMGDGRRLHPGTPRYYPPYPGSGMAGEYPQDWTAGAIVYGTHRWPSRSVLMVPDTYEEREA